LDKEFLGGFLSSIDSGTLEDYRGKEFIVMSFGGDCKGGVLIGIDVFKSEKRRSVKSFH